MGNLVEGLESKQEIALLQEIESARNLLGYGVKAIREGAFLETTRDPILTMLSIGLEKLYKLAVGALVFTDSGAWPVKAIMKGYGHELNELHEALFSVLGEKSQSSTEFVRGLVAAVADAPVVPPLVDALDAYGRMGRFFYLDQLGDSPQTWKGPADAWSEIEAAVLLDPELSEMRDQSFASLADSQLWQSVLDGINEGIATTVELLWDTVAACGKNNLMGRAGVVLGFEVHRSAVGRQ